MVLKGMEQIGRMMAMQKIDKKTTKVEWTVLSMEEELS